MMIRDLSRALGILMVFVCVSCSSGLKSMLPVDAGPAERAAARDCDRGEATACIELSSFYLSRSSSDGGASSNVSQGIELLDAACDSGESRACSTLGRLYLSGTPRWDRGRGLAFFELACGLGDTDSCSVSWEGVTRRLGAQSLYSAGRECDGADPVACLELGSFLVDPSYPYGDPVLGADALEAACSLGSADACVAAAESAQALGPAREDGCRRAISLYERGCALDSAVSCERGGTLYHDAVCGTADVERAHELWRHGCDQPLGTPSCELLPRALESALMGLEADASISATARRCDREDGAACSELATLVEQAGLDGAAELPRPEELRELACYFGDARECAGRRFRAPCTHTVVNGQGVTAEEWTWYFTGILPTRLVDSVSQIEVHLSYDENNRLVSMQYGQGAVMHVHLGNHPDFGLSLPLQIPPMAPMYDQIVRYWWSRFRTNIRQAYEVENEFTNSIQISMADDSVIGNVTYLRDGRPESLRYFGANSMENTEWRYEPNQRLTGSSSAVYSSEGEKSVFYDDQGRVARLEGTSMMGGEPDTAWSSTFEWSGDRLVSIRHVSTNAWSDTASNVDVHYTYDAAGNLTRAEKTRDGVIESVWDLDYSCFGN